MGNCDIDIVTVFHSEENKELVDELEQMILAHEPEGWRFITVDNRLNNRGFAKGCNWGARNPRAVAPIIGFLNPDVTVLGPFIEQVQAAFEDPEVVITGCRFGKPDRELKIWGCEDWVCGAAFFIRRATFVELGGFDEGYVWSWEETDLIRQVQELGLKVKSVELPIEHASPAENTPADTKYKERWFAHGQKRFALKWNRPAPPERDPRNGQGQVSRRRSGHAI